jgi:hypothetical protein
MLDIVAVIAAQYSYVYYGGLVSLWPVQHAQPGYAHASAWSRLGQLTWLHHESQTCFDGDIETQHVPQSAMQHAAGGDEGYEQTRQVLAV